jgi:hypothetical protein
VPVTGGVHQSSLIGQWLTVDLGLDWAGWAWVRAGLNWVWPGLGRTRVVMGVCHMALLGSYRARVHSG